MLYFVDVRITDRIRTKPLIDDHLNYLRAHFDRGDFLFFGAHADGRGGMIIAGAENENSLDEILALDPLHRDDCAAWEVVEFRKGAVSAELLTAAE